MVPVSVVCGSKPNDVLHQFVLEDREKTITLNDVEPGDWLKVRGQVKLKFVLVPNDERRFSI